MATLRFGRPRIQGPEALPILGRVFLAIGLLGLLAATVLAAAEWTGGRVARSEGIVTASGGLPRIEFTTADNRKVHFQSGVRSSFWRDGDKVAVAYDPHAPQDARLDGVAGRWLLPTIFGSLGTVFAVLGIGLAVAGRLVLRRGG